MRLYRGIQGLGFLPPIMEIAMEKSMHNEMGAGAILGFILVRLTL